MADKGGGEGGKREGVNGDLLQILASCADVHALYIENVQIGPRPS